MKAGIISINLHTRKLNYGAVLHSWCFQQLMERRDDIDTCEVIDYITPEMERTDVRRAYLDSIKKKRRQWPLLPFMYRAFRVRYRKFERFFAKRLRVSSRRFTRSDLRAEQLPHDIIFFESDVIWAPDYFADGFEPAYFGALPAMAQSRRIVYSASMGNAEMDAARAEDLRALLEYPDAISMRETYASRIVRELTDKPVADVLDPVLLMDEADFDPITSPRAVAGKYVLTYFPTNVDPDIRLLAKKYADERGYALVEVSDRVAGRLKCRHIASAGIEEFVSLVRNAEAVFCNSLHGVCLSIVFHREFFACQRRTGKKYRDLCERLDLADRYVDAADFTAPRPIDWPKVDTIRASLRDSSLAWLDAQISAAGK